MIKKEDLSIGNVLNYQTAEGDVMPAVIDWQDLKWITEDPEGFNVVHSGIELTPSVMTDVLGFEECEPTYFNDRENITFCGWCPFDRIQVVLRSNGENEIHTPYSRDSITEKRPITHLHQLQNLYHALTGEELTINTQS